MAIPDYQTVMLPLLEHLGDKEEKATRETLDALASSFNLTEEGITAQWPAANFFK